MCAQVRCRGRFGRWVVVIAFSGVFGAGCAPPVEEVDDGCQHEAIGSNGFALGGNCGGKVPKVNKFGAKIDALGSYVGQKKCDPKAKPGVTAFMNLVLATYTCTRTLGIVRACARGGTSEHKEGRAWDWGVYTTNAAGKDLLNWLLKTDEHGNKAAMARRFGIMYMIFDRKIWSAYRINEGWRKYTGANPHTDHVHFSFTWAAAEKKTTFWNGTSPGPDGGAPKVDVGTPRSDAGPRDTGSGSDATLPGAEAGVLPPVTKPAPSVEALVGGCATGGSPSGGLVGSLLLLLLIARRGARPRPR